MDLMDLLVLYGYLSNLFGTYWEAGKEWARQWLGPSPFKTYLLFENEVIPADMEHCLQAPTAQYNPVEHRISRTPTDNSDNTMPYKRMPWLSVQHVMGDHVVDLSDWIADMKSNTSITLLAIVRLAAQVQGRHFPESEHAVVRIITRAGEEQEYRYVGKTKLLQRIAPMQDAESIELRRKQTCPYDSTEGMPIF